MLLCLISCENHVPIIINGILTLIWDHSWSKFIDVHRYSFKMYMKKKYAMKVEIIRIFNLSQGEITSGL